MTNITLHGKLAHKFGKFFKVKIFNILSALKAIDANRSGFLVEIKKMSSQGFDYLIIADGNIIEDENNFKLTKEISNIDIVPVLFGSGPAIVAGIVGVEVAALTTAQLVLAAIIDVVITGLVSLGVSLIMQNLNKQGAVPQQRIAIGGATIAMQAQGRSYTFNNYANAASQGTSIPVGYGRMKIDSQTVSASIKNYPTNDVFINESSTFNRNNAFIDFLTN